jgi:di/tricarboxylate transporter
LVKRYILVGLGLLGLVSLAVSIWWLLTRAAEGGFEPSFFLSAGIFLLVFAAISLRWTHGTAAALLGAVAVWLVHYVGSDLFPGLNIIDFDESMASVDWSVIMLVLGMMICMAMFSETGVEARIL